MSDGLIITTTKFWMNGQNLRSEELVLEILTHSQFELMPIAVPKSAVSTLEASSLCFSAPTFGSGL